jgi:hypothetical protein
MRAPHRDGRGLLVACEARRGTTSTTINLGFPTCHPRRLSTQRVGSKPRLVRQPRQPETLHETQPQPELGLPGQLVSAREEDDLANRRPRRADCSSISATCSAGRTPSDPSQPPRLPTRTACDFAASPIERTPTRARSPRALDADRSSGLEPRLLTGWVAKRAGTPRAGAEAWEGLSRWWGPRARPHTCRGATTLREDR